MACLVEPLEIPDEKTGAAVTRATTWYRYQRFTIAGEPPNSGGTRESSEKCLSGGRQEVKNCKLFLLLAGRIVAMLVKRAEIP